MANNSRIDWSVLGRIFLYFTSFVTQQKAFSRRGMHPIKHRNAASGGSRREIESRRAHDDSYSPDRLGITLSGHRDGRSVEIAVREAVATQHQPGRRQHDAASVTFGTAELVSPA